MTNIERFSTCVRNLEAQKGDDRSYPGYTHSMTTTIKVPNEVRDQLKQQAARARRTLGQHLEHLAGLGEREARISELREAVRATSAEDLASYREEARAWDRIEKA
jgi:hypothetical protein